MWRGRTIAAVIGITLAISAVSMAGGYVSVHYIQASSITWQMARWLTTLASRILPWTLAGFEETGAGEGLLWRRGDIQPFSRGLAWATFVMLTFAGYVLPGIMAGSISRERERRTFEGLAIANLQPSTVLLGKFAAVAGPLLTMALVLRVVAAPVGEASGLVTEAASRLILVAITTSAICLGVSSLCRRTIIAAAFCYAVVFAVDWPLATLGGVSWNWNMMSQNPDLSAWLIIAAPATRGLLAVIGWLIAVRQVRRMMRGESAAVPAATGRS